MEMVKNITVKLVTVVVIIFVAVGVVGIMTSGHGAELQNIAKTSPKDAYPDIYNWDYPFCTLDITDETDPKEEIFGTIWVTYCIRGLEFISVGTYDPKSSYTLGQGFLPTTRTCSCE